MPRHATPESIANEILLARGQIPGPFVVTEGHADSRVYRRSLHGDCSFVVGFGRENVIGAVRRLETAGFDRVVGIVDADFDTLHGDATDQPNLLLTDDRDLEMMLFKSPALDKVLDGFGSSDKIQAFNRSRAESLRDVLLQAALPLGVMRWLNESGGLGLSFDGVTVSHFVDRVDLKADVTKATTEVLNHSQPTEVTLQPFVDQVKAILPNMDPYRVCCGHDVVDVLSFGLSATLGSQRAIDVTRSHVEMGLELAYEPLWFQATALHSRLMEWESRHQGLKLTVA